MWIKGINFERRNVKGLQMTLLFLVIRKPLNSKCLSIVWHNMNSTLPRLAPRNRSRWRGSCGCRTWSARPRCGWTWTPRSTSSSSLSGNSRWEGFQNSWIACSSQNAKWAKDPLDMFAKTRAYMCSCRFGIVNLYKTNMTIKREMYKSLWNMIQKFHENYPHCSIARNWFHISGSGPTNHSHEQLYRRRGRRQETWRAQERLQHSLGVSRGERAIMIAGIAKKVGNSSTQYQMDELKHMAE